MILLKYAACVTATTPVTHLCVSVPLRYPSPVTPPHTHPTHTHIHAQVTDTTEGAREGVQSGLRCKTPPVCFNFHLPHHDPLQLVTQVASRCTSLLFFSSPVCPRIPSLLNFSVISSDSLLFTAIDGIKERTQQVFIHDSKAI